MALSVESRTAHLYVKHESLYLTFINFIAKQNILMRLIAITDPRFYTSCSVSRVLYSLKLIFVRTLLIMVIEFSFVRYHLVSRVGE